RRHQHGDGGGGANCAGRRHPGPDRHHARWRQPVHREVGAAMTWDLFAVFLGSSIRLATPLLLAGIGEMVSERAGVLNMSIEGMMLMSAFAAAVGAWVTGDAFVGLLIGIVSVVPVALLQAFLSNALRANQIVSGIDFNILVLGATTLAYREIFG